MMYLRPENVTTRPIGSERGKSVSAMLDPMTITEPERSTSAEAMKRPSPMK
jgi:hypothetical protein